MSRPALFTLQAGGYCSEQATLGVNKPRSRGDRAEVFGGKGASWKGAFVGGDLLVQAVTEGEGEVYGDFATYSLFPETV